MTQNNPPVRGPDILPRIVRQTIEAAFMDGPTLTVALASGDVVLIRSERPGMRPTLLLKECEYLATRRPQVTGEIESRQQTLGAIDKLVGGSS